MANWPRTTTSPYNVDTFFIDNLGVVDVSWNQWSPQAPGLQAFTWTRALIAPDGGRVSLRRGGPIAAFDSPFPG